MKNPRFLKTNQDFINFISSTPAFFLAVLYSTLGALPTKIGVFDFVIIILASFRITRLFVYDKVMEFFRDLFVDIKSVEVQDDEVVVRKKNFPYGIRRTVHDLLYCPWCTNAWVSLFIAFFYFLSPVFWFFIFMFAVSGAGTFIQIITNKVEFK